MMSKDLLQSAKLKSISRKFKNNEIFDIVLYGSIVRGKDRVNDVDIAVILNKKTSLNKKLKIAASLKDKLRFLGIEIDVKVIDISDLMDPAFMARESIIAEGYSLLKRKFLHEIFGFKAYILFFYELNNLSKSKKKMFYYALKGRRNQKGLITGRGTQIGNCILKIKLRYSEEFEKLFKYHNIKYSTERILSYS